MQLNTTNADATLYNLCFDTKGVQLTKDTKYWVCPACSTNQNTAGTLTEDVMVLGACISQCKPWVNTT